MKKVSIKSAFTSGLIGLCIGLVITYIMNLLYPSGNSVWVLVAVGNASFFASFWGNIAGQQE